MAIPVVTELGEMYRLADTGAIVSLFSRLGRVNKTSVLVTSYAIMDHSC